MATLDLVVFGLYLVGLLVMGMFFVRRMKSTGEMFAAGGQSPWWLSGLSAFMTMFSAGTFVVWGGIAYQMGMVAVAICMCYGVSALLAGWFLAGLWKSLGVQSAAEFLELRFGNSIVQFYTWLQGTIGIFGMGGSIYALSVLVCALVVLPEGSFFADPETGRLSVTLMSLVICAVVVTITLGGGLWAVLMTDVMQFIILTVAVVVVVPMLFSETGGVTSFIDKSPEGFFVPVANDFTWWFLAGWVAVHFFKVGAEWAFVQRFVCVPTARDARKSTYLFAVMYLVSPIFWMLPPMIYRTIDPSADPEQAYILACRLVLPAGMMGLMIAAMSSATASMVTTFLNVYAGAFTTEFYRRYWRPLAGERELVMAGRIITLLLGGLVVAGALIIPAAGSYTGYVLTTAAIFSGPLMLPTIWGLFSRKIGLRTLWVATLGGMAAAVIVKFGLGAGGWVAHWPMLQPLAELAQINARVTDLVVGSLAPLLVLVVAEVLEKRTHPGWDRLQVFRNTVSQQAPVMASTLPALLCGWAVVAIAVLMGVLAMLDRDDSTVLGVFALILSAIAGAIFLMVRSSKDKLSVTSVL
jgi:SSS family solute:Na+ symporter